MSMVEDLFSPSGYSSLGLRVNLIVNCVKLNHEPVNFTIVCLVYCCAIPLSVNNAGVG